MNERQRRFIDNYIQTGNAAESARQAGYSDKSAYSIGERLLRNVEVRGAIDARLSELESQRTAQTREVLEHLTLALRGKISEKIVTNAGKKVSVPIRECDRLKAAEMLLKVQGAFKDKVDVKVSGAELYMQTLQRIWAKRDGRADN